MYATPVEIHYLCRSSSKRWSRTTPYPSHLSLGPLVDTIKRNLRWQGRLVMVYAADGTVEARSTDPGDTIFTLYRAPSSPCGETGESR